jgi:hypothetical protein
MNELQKRMHSNYCYDFVELNPNPKQSFVQALVLSSKKSDLWFKSVCLRV